jgi:hydroxyethylthiazole kinase-like uncharacterized protein yjeF
LKLVAAGEMREIERKAGGLGLDVSTLMERAGLGVAREVVRMLGEVSGREVLVLVGPGNNGGDGLVAARHLSDWGARVSLYLLGREDPEEPLLLECRRRQVPWARGEEDQDLVILQRFLATADAALDALLGTGRFRPLEGLFKIVLERVGDERKKRSGLKLIALDLPSGLGPDTGKVDPATPVFDVTITVGYPKRGLYAFPGASHAGKISFVDLGLPQEAAKDVATELLTPEWAARLLPPRPAEANKGTFGRVLVVAGSENYVGAACLACLGAYRVGAGLVTLASLRSLHPVFAVRLTEVTHLPLPDEGGFLGLGAWQALVESIPGYDVVLLGCGIGRAPVVARFVEAFLGAGLKKPLILDADGLNNLAGREGWWEKLPEGAVLTPHPGEMARLTGLAISEIQGDRPEVARRFAGRWGRVLVLKGAFTVVASPGGEVRLSPFGNPALASAGTGDVLSGAIAGLLAQGLSPFDAASLGVFLHGHAGELAREGLGEAGVMASDLVPLLPLAIKKLKGEHG